MRNLTKKAIKESFLKLLESRSIAQITVKDIVEDCGINRNTFYYHFEDIPSLIQEIITDEVNEIIRKYPTVDTIEECLQTTLEFALKQKTLVYHIYCSARRDIFEHYLSDVCQHLSAAYIESITRGRSIRESDKQLMVRLHKAVVFGVAMGWIESGMRQDILNDLHDLHELFDGYADTLIQRCEARNTDK